MLRDVGPQGLHNKYLNLAKIWAARPIKSKI